VVTYQSDEQLNALGDPTRRAIFERLAKGPLAVVEIAHRLPISRPAVSQHLKILKEARLVMDHAEGTRRVYRLDPQGLAAIRDYFGQFWTDALDAFKRTVEQTPTTQSDKRRGQRPNRKDRSPNRKETRK
jgi:DNA-binding transcriptional ArsR family regulator